MIVTRTVVLLPLAVSGGEWQHNISGLPDGRPLIIAHRGACGVYPAHSKVGYEYAIQQVCSVQHISIIIEVTVGSKISISTKGFWPIVIV